MKPFYDAVVVGSGFGGAVTACRLAQAGLSVVVLERGRRYGRGSFPRNYHALRGWSWAHDHGLFDVRPLNELLITQAAGWGGGSLVYANVQIRPPPDAFAAGWPAGYSREALDPYYDLVAWMLDVQPITSAPLGLPAKALRMREAAEQLGRAGQMFYPNLAVDFSTPGKLHTNKFGMAQSGCVYCAECIVGCNFSAKNTLDLNYLALAESHGAEAQTLHEVWKLEPASRGYRVSFRDHAGGGALGQVDASHVFLCAGAANTTELLLRCRDEYRTLRSLSPRLGYDYFGNGDSLAFGFGSNRPFDSTSGPSITSGIVFDRVDDGRRTWFLLEEGALPPGVVGLARLLDPKAQVLHAALAAAGGDLERLARRVAAPPREAAPARPQDPAEDMAVFFAMGRDLVAGRIMLMPGYKMFVRWEARQNTPLYDAEESLVRDVMNVFGGRVALNPLWRWLRQPMTVHNLGGCAMAERVEHGVTDPYGQVHNYPGLYIADASILPACTGVNPSHTIAAVAERNVEQVIRTVLRDPAWRAPEMQHAPRIVDPVARVVVPPEGTVPASPAPAVGARFRETLHGFIVRGFQPCEGYLDAELVGAELGAWAEGRIEIEIPDVDRFADDDSHVGALHGWIRIKGFTEELGAPVQRGLFQLFPRHDDAGVIRYSLPFIGADGASYLVDGHRAFHAAGSFDAIDAVRCINCLIREGHARGGAIVGTGILRTFASDLVGSALSVRVSGSKNPIRHARAALRIGCLAASGVGKAYVSAWRHALDPILRRR